MVRQYRETREIGSRTGFIPDRYRSRATGLTAAILPPRTHVEFPLRITRERNESNGLTSLKDDRVMAL
jgi:hypothetical protein